jgi:hypothetical protein
MYDKYWKFLQDAGDNFIERKMLGDVKKEDFSVNELLRKVLMSQKGMKTPNLYSEKTARIAMSEIFTLTSESRSSKTFARFILSDQRSDRERQTGVKAVERRAANLLGIIDFRHIPELVKIFGKRVSLHHGGFLGSWYQSQMPMPVFYNRHLVVVDHFMERFCQRVTPERNYESWSEREKAYFDFVHSGPENWGMNRLYFVIRNQETKGFIEAFYTEGRGWIYFLGTGGLTNPRSSPDDLYPTYRLHGFLYTCLSEKDLSPKKRKFFEKFRLTSESCKDEGQEIITEFEGWRTSPPMILESHGKPYGRK